MRKAKFSQPASLFILLCFFITVCEAQKLSNSKTYFISNTGNDEFPGSKEKPWKSIDHLNKMQLKPGDKVCFLSGIYHGTILINSIKKGNHFHPIIITSLGKNPAIIVSGDSTGILVYQTSHIRIEHLHLIGSGRKSGNIKNGLLIVNSNHIDLNDIDIKGYQKSGLEIYSCYHVIAQHITAHDNGFAGISVSGNDQNKLSTKDIVIRDCKAVNNPGDPSNLTNHSGNGIIVSHCTNVIIEYCAATNNGWDMPRVGNGPVGIWMYEADSVLMQYCISYRNKTSKGAADGGGFDIDGGVTNSIIQYCLSYENYGSAFGIFQYYEAGPWYNNSIRYCISENDGLVSDARAGVYIWNGQGDSTRFHHCYFYNNSIYNSKGAAISYSDLSKNMDFYFFNNIFVSQDSLIKGIVTNTTFLGNDWWSLGKFSIEGRSSLKEWAISNDKELKSGQLTGLQINPKFKKPGSTHLTDPRKLSTFFNYQLPSQSPLKVKGQDLTQFGVQRCKMDFNHHLIHNNGIGACF